MENWSIRPKETRSCADLPFTIVREDAPAWDRSGDAAPKSRLIVTIFKLAVSEVFGRNSNQTITMEMILDWGALNVSYSAVSGANLTSTDQSRAKRRHFKRFAEQVLTL